MKETRISIPIKRVDGYEGELPRPVSTGAAGLDLPAHLQAPLTIEPSGRVLIPTGIAVAIPAGFEGQVRPRSGLALRHGVTVLNSPGTIDSDYRGQIQIILINLGNEPFVVKPGDRIAQLIIAPVTAVDWEETPDLPETGRGSGGFGHTGR